MKCIRYDSGSRRIIMRDVVIFVFPGANLLDVAGPAQVFTSATELHSSANPGELPAYKTAIVSLDGGMVETTSGIQLNSVSIAAFGRSDIDTLLIAGGHGSEAAGGAEEIVDWLHRMRSKVRRIGSICTGAFVLAAAGLADGRRLATHWAYCDRLEEQYPGLTVERDAIFVEDSGLWSSAGITSGLDLALAMVEQDYGRELALMVARQLVVFLKRPGGQSQFSVPLQAQSAEGPLAELASWVTGNPAGDYRVDTLAERSKISPRTLHRLFRETFGRSPAQWIASMRVESARRLLEQSDLTLQEIATRTGLGTADTMRRIFLRQLGITPSDYRDRFRLEVSASSPAVQHAMNAEGAAS
jgi:transcriptional regulator GlxA family with amidase domain